jgi:hypothetical protein
MQLTFTGTLRPAGTNLQADFGGGPLKLTVGNSIFGEYRLQLGFEGERFSVRTITSKDVDDLLTFRNEILTFVRAAFDSFSYLFGQVIHFDFEMVRIEDAAEDHIIIDGVEELRDTQQERPVKFPELVFVVIKSPHLGRALADLRRAMEYAWDTAFFCFRAVEDIMQAFSSAGKEDRPAAWKKMREELNIDRTWLKELEDESKLSRHGRPRSLSRAERVLLMERAWRVIDRFSAYRKLGGQASLPHSDFPVLRA